MQLIFKPNYINQGVLFPLDLNEKVGANHPCRVIHEVVSKLNISTILQQYKGGGTSSYDPRMLLSILFYGYLNNTYSCRKIAKAIEENIYFMWLSGGQTPDFRTINDFRGKRLKGEIDDLFSQIVKMIVNMGLVSLEKQFVDGTKLEANASKYSCVAMQYGIASKFYTTEYNKVPLVVKLNGKTSLGTKPLSVANATVEDAVEIGARAVGFTIYLGSEYEAEMVREFSHIRDVAHRQGLAVFAWMYPFITPPSSNDDELEADVVAYAARAGAELGADVVKIKYPHQPEKLPWIIENAVGTKAIMSGGDKVSEEEFLKKVKTFIDAGGAGAAIGRNAWQHPDPIALAEKVRKVIFGD